MPRADTSSLVAVLEVVATERPDALPWAAAAMAPTAYYEFAEISRSWGIQPYQIADTAAKATRDLDRLIRTRRQWSNPRQVTPTANPTALYCVGLARFQRPHKIAPARLGSIVRKLAEAYETERQRRRLIEFIDNPLPPPRGDWLRKYLPRTSTR